MEGVRFNSYINVIQEPRSIGDMTAVHKLYL